MKLHHTQSISALLIVLIVSMPLCFASEIESYTYDANGNLVTGDGYYREYNEFNQLVKMRNGSNASAPLVEEYFYNAEGIRMLTIQNNSGAETKIYTPSRELMRIVNSSGTFDYRYVYAGYKLVARLDPDGNKSYYHTDHLGSTDLITDSSGLLVEETLYAPFGMVESGGENERKLYTGHEQDDTGQTYMKARYYLPGRGQFISPDRIMQDVYNPQDLNRFAYVRNNPYRYTDPDGHIAYPVAAAITAVAWYMGDAFVAGLIDQSTAKMEAEMNVNQAEVAGSDGMVTGVGVTPAGPPMVSSAVSGVKWVSTYLKYREYKENQEESQVKCSGDGEACAPNPTVEVQTTTDGSGTTSQPGGSSGYSYNGGGGNTPTGSTSTTLGRSTGGYSSGIRVTSSRTDSSGYTAFDRKVRSSPKYKGGKYRPARSRRSSSSS